MATRWWDNKVSLDQDRGDGRTLAQMLAGDHLPDSEEQAESVVLRAALDYFFTGRSPKERYRKLILALICIEEIGGDLGDLAKWIDRRPEWICRERPKVLAVIKELMRSDLARRKTQFRGGLRAM